MFKISMTKIEEYGPIMQSYFFSNIFPPRLIKKEYFGEVGKVDKKGNHFIGERCWSHQFRWDNTLFGKYNEP